MPISVLRSSFPGWAETAEVYVPSTDPPAVEFSLDIPQGSKFFVACTSAAGGLSIPGEALLEITTPDWDGLGIDDLNTTNRFVDPKRGLIVALDPPAGPVTVQVKGNPNNPQRHLIYATAFAGAGPPATIGCIACKITAKAIAAAIVAFVAATAGPVVAPLIPVALVQMVAGFSAVSIVTASAFIVSVIHQSVDEIAEKLCKLAHIC